ncbi:MAG: glycosyltransferase family 4 protein [Candidatus Binatus sp.]|uniref:glycosyltransferase family 4 protein n=1 Tax=Candidatus Binatus sp. TaxID=2811406 RepID=UPI002727F403|nr:glycosyltransferase family 4 protein [Candidatus Binatus sp.]MDO8431602.1 glycosyltransferase family 4 protein [Candidatus Binatus sp.]
MKVLYLNPTGQLGGAERSLLLLMESIKAARPKWQLELIAGAEGPLIDRALELGVRATAIPFPRALSRLGDSSASGAGRRLDRLALAGGIGRAGVPGAAYLYKLRGAIAERAPKVIHSNGFKMHILGAWARTAGTPLIWHIRDYVGSRPLMSRLIRANAHRCTAAIANSNSVAEDLRSVCGGNLRVEMIYNAVDLDKFNPRGEAADLDKLAGMDAPASGTIRVGMIATMARWKGHEVFLRALSKLAGKFPLRAYVIGGSLYETLGSQHRIEDLRKMATELGVEHVVGFTGFLDDTAAAMRALDIVVHASTEPEPFGLAIAEGMACGKPVIASGAGGAAEIVEPKVDALTHRPGDVDGLAECIERLALDGELRKRIGAAARVSAERQFGRERLVAGILPIYDGVASAAA